jgi:uncharacterized Zn finger protein (UPF0148 family)
MSIEQKLVRVEPADPTRCQSGGAQGQCPFQASQGSNYCPRHGGNKAIQAAEKEAVRTYRLHTWENRKNELADDGKIKSLREEIGITRILIEELVNQCTTSTDLILNSVKISDLVMKLEKLVVSCNTLEMKMGMLLDRATIIQIGSMIVEIVARYVQVPEEREEAAQAILEVVSNTIVQKDK